MGNSHLTQVSLQGQFSICSGENHMKLPGPFPTMTCELLNLNGNCGEGQFLVKK